MHVLMDFYQTLILEPQYTTYSSMYCGTLPFSSYKYSSVAVLNFILSVHYYYALYEQRDQYIGMLYYILLISAYKMRILLSLYLFLKTTCFI